MTPKNRKQHVDWNAVADDYHNRVGDQGDLYHQQYLNPIVLSLLGDVNHQEILDLGCGQGYFARLLAKRGAKVTGVDVSEKLLGLAKAREEKDSLGISYHLNNADALIGIANESIDAIIANMVFHSVDNIEKAFQECARVLKKGGRFIFSLPHPTIKLAERIKDINGYYVVLKNYRTPKQIPASLYEDKGFKEWYRPIGLYIHMLTNNGFFVSAMEEVYTKHRKGKAIKEKAMLEHKQEFPSFLVMAALKPIDIFSDFKKS